MENKPGYMLERLAIFIFSSIYLIIFNVELPHGDALRIVRQIEVYNLDWNPNHLILDPLGYGWYRLLESFNFNISPLSSFEIISSVATIISLVLFHAVLTEAGIRNWSVRILAVVGLLASKNFLSMAVTQYYFMIQMPFLLGALLFIVRYVSADSQDNKENRYLFFIGVLLAVATAIEINNVVLVFFVGPMLGLIYREKISWHWQTTASMWGASALVGIPLFVIGYFMSGSDNPFFTWMLTYAGADSSSMSQLYGLQWTLKGLFESLFRLIYNLLFGNFIETAGVGIFLKSMVAAEPLEFLPNVTRIAMALLLMPVIAGMQGVLFVWSFTKLKKDKLILILITWLFAYLIFAFLWNNGGDIFWFQTLPVIILLLTYFINAFGSHLVSYSLITNHGRKFTWLLGITSVLLLVVNTLQMVVPVAFVNMEGKIAHHGDLLRSGDLEITTGWDKYKWMNQSTIGLSVDKLMLMNMATKPVSDENHISNLNKIVKKHLESGGRVVVARVYDLDSELNPWSGLARMGWPRSRIQEMLKGYCNKKIGQIDDVVFRELYFCDK